MTESIKILECPFTWKFNVQGEAFSKLSRPEECGDYYLGDLISLIMNAYTLAENGKNTEAYENLREADNVWENLDLSTLEKENVSLNVVRHILNATKYYLLVKLEDSTEADKLLDTLEDSTAFTDKDELGTLYGCKSLAAYNDRIMATSLIRQAIEICPECPLWHFLLARQLRRDRRSTPQNTFMKPSEEEIQEFLTSYKMSKNSYYGVFLAQAYRESRQYENGDKVYLDMFNEKPSSANMQLRLALGFIRKRDFERARSCLDYVEKIMPDNLMFLHYKGIYFQKQCNHRMAAKYFQEAARGENFSADVNYAYCMTKIDENFDYGEHLKNVLKKYESKNTDYEQTILLYLAIHYCDNEKDVINATKYFSKAITIDPGNSRLQKFFSGIVNKEYDISYYINRKLFKLTQKDTEAEKAVLELQTLYRK